MGKPISDSEGEVDWVYGILRYFAEQVLGFWNPKPCPSLMVLRRW